MASAADVAATLAVFFPWLTTTCNPFCRNLPAVGAMLVEMVKKACFSG